MTNSEVEDWRYSDFKMQLRRQVLSLLIKRFGSELNENGEPKYSNQSIYECAHDWVSQGNKSCLLYTSPSPRDKRQSRMPSSA